MISRRILKCIVLIAIPGILIIDTQTATNGVLDGIEICVRSVIPALFPFLIVIPLICQEFFGQSLKFLSPVRRLCKLPVGADSILLFGMLGGYPAGAGLIAEAYRNKTLSCKDAQRMLGFCSNAGPAFIFGIVAPLFEQPWIPWLLWGIHIISAVIVGYLTRKTPDSAYRASHRRNITVIQQIERSIKMMSVICAWVILFRLISNYLDNWLIHLLPEDFKSVVVGILELSNGCIMLKTCQSEFTRFVICSGLLGFGGLCVTLQTKSVCGALGMGNYFPGKLLQSAISVLLSWLFAPIFIQISLAHYLSYGFIILISVIVCVFLIKKEKNYSKMQLLGV